MTVETSHIIPLYKSGAQRPSAWECELCTRVYRLRAHAIQCCKPWRCPTCNSLIRHGSPCTPCWQTKQSASRQRLYDDATKIPISEYKKPLFSPIEDRFFDSPELAEEWLDENPGAPRWFFGSFFVPVSLDADDLMEIAVGEHHEDAEAADAGLSEFIERWNAAQTDGTWYDDTSVVVLMDEEEAPTCSP